MIYHTLKIPSLSSSVFLSIAHFFADDQGTSLLYSGGCFDSAKRSYLGIFPFETIAAYGDAIHHQKGENLKVYSFENPWEGLQEYFFKPLAQDPEAMAFGWFGYGMGAFADPDQRLPYRSSSLPDAYWQRCAVVLDRNAATGETVIQINLAVLEQVQKEVKCWIQRFSTLEGWKAFLDLLPQKNVRYETHPTIQFFHDDPDRRAPYIDKIEQAQELIRSGEIYQVNLSHLFEFESERHPFSFFRQICNVNPAPFSAYFRHKEATIVSTSPERFLCKTETLLETRPIKGTMRRGKTKKEDERLKETLLGSSKERAELLMITDLMRNDLGKISKVGTVQTLDLWRCEAYTNVFHLLSIIQSVAKTGLTSLEIIRSCFPGGSITGCPKLRAMEVIDDLERRPRGIYTGSLGYIKGQGDFDLNIAIRTLVKERGKYFLQLGSGIVIDSDPNLEYEETIFKGDSLFYSLQTKEITCD